MKLISNAIVTAALLLASKAGADVWSPLFAGGTHNLYSAYFTDTSTGFAVGGNGSANASIIYKTTNAGGSWSPVSTGATLWLSSVFFTGAAVGYAVGDTGVILRTFDAGASWTPTASGTNQSLNAVYFPSANIGFAVGDNGALLSTANAGASWTPVASGTSNQLLSVYFANANTGFAVGSAGTIVKTTNAGVTWDTVSSGTTHGLRSVYFTSATTGYAVGDSGVILKTTNTGTTWTVLTSGTISDLHGVHFTNATTGWALGMNGTILKTTNSGVAWTPQVSGTPAVLNGVFFATVNAAYAVGGGDTILKLDRNPVITYTANISDTVGKAATHNANSTGGGPVTSYSVSPALPPGLSLNTGTGQITGTPTQSVLLFPDTITATGPGGSGIFVVNYKVVLAAPVPASPANNATGVSFSTSLAWSAPVNAANYHVELATDTGFTAIVVDDSTLTSPSKAVGPLLNITVYYWRVNARNAAGTGAWSPRQKFTTMLAIPAAPVLASPADNATDVATSPTLSWNAALGAADYRLQVAVDAAFSAPTFVDNTGAATSLLVGPLNPGTVYYWRVYARNAIGTGPWSGTQQFTTTGDAAITGKVPLAQSVSMGNGNVLQFSLPHASLVTIKLFDSKGSVVAELLNEKREAGSYLLPLSSANLGGSYYLLDFKADGFHKTMKISP